MRFETRLFIPFLLLAACATSYDDIVSMPASEVFIVDGDTVRFDDQRVRLKGWDTPEPRTGFKCEAERQLGKAATDEAKRLLSQTTTVTFKIVGTDRYDRLLAHYEFDGRNVGELLAAKGLAQRWDYDAGASKPKWC